MSRRVPVSSDLLFHTLASSGGVFTELLGYWQGLLDEYTQTLHELAVNSLSKPELVSLAQMQKGKCMMLQELIDHANQFKS